MHLRTADDIEGEVHLPGGVLTWSVKAGVVDVPQAVEHLVGTQLAAAGAEATDDEATSELGLDWAPHDPPTESGDLDLDTDKPKRGRGRARAGE